MVEEVLRLFKSYVGEKSNKIFPEELKFGLAIPDTASPDVVRWAIEMYGKKGNEWNQTFHKSFSTVANAPLERLIVQQIVHYFTTYGFESLGCYDKDTVYIPKEELNVPELNVDGIELIPIKAITEEELTEKLMTLLTSGIALSDLTVNDIIALSDYIDKERFDEIKNRQIRTYLYSKYHMTPKNPDEFFKLLIYNSTGETLKINNRDLIEKIKYSDRKIFIDLINTYVNTVPDGYEKLSSIFLRNKNLFLAYKVHSGISQEYYKQYRKEVNHIINRLRKLADKNHKPLNIDALESLINFDASKRESKEYLKSRLDNITIFREFRILNGIRYRLYGYSNSIVYKIRNGKSFATDISDLTQEQYDNLKAIELIFVNHIGKRLSDKLYGKTVYIPENVKYAVPTSEKQFVENIPFGTCITVPRDKDMVYGIHWFNLEPEKPNAPGYMQSEWRVDLDLKQMNAQGTFGWDGDYRNIGRSVLFSGDITDAPRPYGATELFYVTKNCTEQSYLVTVNNFTQNRADVPFEFVIAYKGEIHERHTLDPNNILVQLNCTIKWGQGQVVLGNVVIDRDMIRFYVEDFSQGNARTARMNNYSNTVLDYLDTQRSTQLKLEHILEYAGAKVVRSKTVQKEVLKVTENEQGDVIATKNDIIEVAPDYDLSLESITKETFVKLFTN